MSGETSSMNHSEKLFLEKCVDPPYFLEIKYRRISPKIPSAVFSDVKEKFPDIIKGGTITTLKFADQFAEEDGLINDFSVVERWKGKLPEPHVESYYLEALMTIWIANFTELQSCAPRKTGKTLMRNQRKFETCLMTYFFNDLVLVPKTLREYAEERTIERYGIDRWLFSTEELLDYERGKALIDILHKCMLQIKE